MGSVSDLQTPFASGFDPGVGSIEPNNRLDRRRTWLRRLAS